MFAAILTILCGTSIMTSCGGDDDNPVVTPVKQEKNYFPSWNNCEALTALQDYVKDVTDPQSPNFISEEDRIATFDMDGTFVGELYPTYFEYNMLEYRALDDPDYRDKDCSSQPFRHEACPCSSQGLRWNDPRGV